MHVSKFGALIQGREVVKGAQGRELPRMAKGRIGTEGNLFWFRKIRRTYEVLEMTESAAWKKKKREIIPRAQH